MISQKRVYELMQEAVIESKKSISEDRGIHPKVGAILADSDGNIIVSAHRGETGSGDHSEYILLKKATELGIDTSECILFVTLEPCTSRSPGKTPCAQRIVDAKIRKVYLGMLDPNPLICGRGESFLRIFSIVERFPSLLIKQIEEINEDFVSMHRSELLPDNSLYVSRQISDIMAEHLQRQGINIKEIPADWDLTIEDIIDYCCATLQGNNQHNVEKAVICARNESYDKKYSEYTYENDSRGIGDHWINEVKEILNLLNINDLSQYSVINVGASNGLEAKELFYDVKDLILVDIGNNSLENAKRLIPYAKTIQNGAECLTDINSGIKDIYISLRTFQSSYFDISRSIREAYRVLKPNGVIVISIANGFIGNNDVLIPGLVIPKTKVVDRNRPFELGELVRKKLTLLRFKSVGVRTGLGEIYIYGRRE